MPPKPKAALLIVHGLAEHSSRYLAFAEKLVEADISVYSFDGRGHGKSSPKGPTAYISNYEDYVKDIDALFKKVCAYSADLPVFIFGHSMGGGLLVSYVLNYNPELAGIILSAPLLKPDDNVPKILLAVSALLSKIAPKLKVLRLDSNMISHDPEEVRKYHEDPLMYHDAVPARTGHEMVKMMKAVEGKMSQFSLPVLMMHGEGDRLTNPRGTEMLYLHAVSKDKTFKRYPELYHELLNEYEKEEITQDILNWVQDRIK